MAAEVAEIRALVQRPATARRPGSHDTARRRASFVETLFRRHQRSLLWYIARLVPNRSEAEEVAQEAFLRLLCAERLEADPQRARNYLFATATNLVRDNHRRKTARAHGAHVAIDDLQIESREPDPAQTIDAERGRRIVEAALRDLQPRPREAFLLYVHEELTYECIATRLGVSKKTIERDIAFTLALCRSRLTRWSEA
jgi:RNA polymerase sigma-70 factor (ECF subfamily)